MKILFCLTIGVCSIWGNCIFAMPTLHVTPSETLLDEEIHITVTGLRSFEKIQIKAQTKDDNGFEWRSHGLFKADENGNIDLSKCAPLDGSYEGIDPVGLLWSMRLEDSQKGASFKVKRDQFKVQLKAYQNGQEVAQKEITRCRLNKDIQKIPIRENGLVATLFLPTSEKPLPVIITLSGSNGGLGENRAKLLASNGFATLALGYFGVDGLPPNLQNIPLEYFESAFGWIQQHPKLDSTSVGVYGVSRGAELALILGSLFSDQIHAIVATSPSSVIHSGLGKTPCNAWTCHGKQIGPFAKVPMTDFSTGVGSSAQNPAHIRDAFLEAIKDKESYKQAAIPVENITASLMIISGGDDQMWPSEIYANEIQNRLQINGSDIKCIHLHYPRAGHGFSIPNLPHGGPLYFHPKGQKWFSMGGSFYEDQNASQDSWKKLVLFFQSELSRFR